MTVHGQTLGVFKHDNNECIDTGATTTLNKNKIVVLGGYVGYDAFFVTKYVIMTYSMTKNDHRDCRLYLMQ